MTDVTELHRDVGELRGTVAALSAEVTKLREQVENLTAVLNQGKGARWIIFLLPTTIGVGAGFLSYFGFKLTLGH